MLKKWLIFTFIFILGCGSTMKSIQKEYSDSAFSPNFAPSKIYHLAVLPISAISIKMTSAELTSLYDYASLELLKTGYFILVERDIIEDIVMEQGFGISGIVDVSSAAKIGKVIGADAVFLTQVTKLKRDEFFKDEDAYDAEVFVRLIDASTAEILFFGKGRGNSMQGKVNAVEMAISNATTALQGGVK